MSKNQTPKATSMPTFDGRQIRIQDGLQMVTNGAQVMSEGLQMVARPQQGNQLPDMVARPQVRQHPRALLHQLAVLKSHQ